jgi:hypothetical protein
MGKLMHLVKTSIGSIILPLWQSYGLSYRRKEGSLDGDQVPAVEVIRGVNADHIGHGNDNLAHLFWLCKYHKKVRESFATMTNICYIHRTWGKTLPQEPERRCYVQ